MMLASKSCLPHRLVHSGTPVGCRRAFWVLMILPCLLTAQTPTPPTLPDQPKPEPVKTSITVVDKISAETPANITVMDALSLQESPGTNLDDRLRDVPGFSLFRRSSSLVANPTTQG